MDNCPVCLKELDYPDYSKPPSLENSEPSEVAMDKDEELDEYFDEFYCVKIHVECEDEYIRKNNIFWCLICETSGYKNNNNSICLYEHNKCVYKQPVYDTIIIQKTPKFGCYVFESEVNDNIIHRPYHEEDYQPYHVNTYHKKCVPESICEICNEGFDENNYKNIKTDSFVIKKYHTECCEKIKNLCFCKNALFRSCKRCLKHEYRCYNYYQTAHNYNYYGQGSIMNEDDWGCDPDDDTRSDLGTDSDDEKENWGEDFYCKRCTRIRSY